MDSTRPIYYSTSVRRVERAPPGFSRRSSLTQGHRWIGPRHVTSPMNQPVRLMYLSVSDGTSEPVVFLMTLPNP